MEFLEHRLDNGLQIIAECNDEVHTAAMGFFVHAGARDETDEVAGVSHFLEHMVFKGTPTRTPEDVNREFDELGAHSNASTSEEHTIYYASYLPEYQGRIVELWADCLRPSLRDEDFDTEKKVIIEEIRMYQDQPPYGADDMIKRLHYGGHPLARSVLGTVESITALDVDNMRRYFQQRYSPSNITLAAAGRVDFEALVAEAERRCGAWEPFEAGRELIAPEFTPRTKVVSHEASVQEYVMQLANGPAGDDPRRYAAKLVAAMLGDDSGSRMYWELIDSGIAESASLGHYDYEGTGLFFTYMSCQPEATKPILEAIAAIYRDAEQHGFRADELARAKSKIGSRLVLSSERPRSRLFSVGGAWIQERHYRTVKQEIESYRAVTLDDAHALLGDFPLSESTTLAIGPLATLDA